MKNTCPFYCIVFQVLKELLKKIIKCSYQIFYFLLFLVAFTSADIIFHKFLELHSTLSEKKKAFPHKLSFLAFTQPPSPYLLNNSQNSLSTTKVFCQSLLRFQTKAEPLQVAILTTHYQFISRCVNYKAEY